MFAELQSLYLLRLFDTACRLARQFKSLGFLSAPSCLMPPNVTELSDDETVAPQPLPAPDETSVVSKTRPSCKRKLSALELASVYSDIQGGTPRSVCGSETIQPRPFEALF